MSGYIPNPDDPTQPVGAQYAQTAAAEFRALKAKMLTFSPLFVGWNPNDKADWIALYSGDLLPQVINGGGGFLGQVRATKGTSGGTVYYIEHTIGTNASGKTEVGITTIDTPVSTPGTDCHIGLTPGSIGYRSNGQVWANGALVGTDATYTFGDVIGIYWTTTGSVSFYKNGVFNRFVTWPALYASAPKYPVVGLAAVGDYLVTNFGATPYVFPISGASPLVTTTSPITGPQNILVNPDFYLDQRNAHAAYTPIANGDYCADRWRYSSTFPGVLNAQATIGSQTDQAATQGALAYQRFTVAVQTVPGAADYFYFSQKIEGLKISELAYGGGNARLATLLFYVRASVAGTYSGALQNSAKTLSFPFSFAISASQLNTWVRMAIPIQGSSSGAWNIDNTLGLEVMFNLGAGANFEGPGNSWNVADDRKVTGAINFCSQPAGSTIDFTFAELKLGYYTSNGQVERISTPAQLLECQRYYHKFTYAAAGYVGGVNAIGGTIRLPTQMRVNPTPTVTANVNTNCANSTVNVADAQTVAVNSVGAGAGGYVQQCTVALDAEF